MLAKLPYTHEDMLASQVAKNCLTHPIPTQSQQGERFVDCTGKDLSQASVCQSASVSFKKRIPEQTASQWIISFITKKLLESKF